MRKTENGPDVKICGLCRTEDAAAAAAAGATHQGVVLARGYARTRSRAEAAAILAAGGSLCRVGVFVDEPFEAAIEAAEELGLNVIQMHGEESPEYLARLGAATGLEVWRALRPRSEEELLQGMERFGGAADALLIEGWHPSAAGGTGARVSLPMLAGIRDALPAGVRFVLAGGLTPANVAELVAVSWPDIVDVSSGVESEPGRKDAAAMHAFVRSARSPAATFADRRSGR